MTMVTCKRMAIALLMSGCLLVAGAAPAAAQGPGVRGGLSVNPDQGYLGAHYETGALVEHFHFRPNLEIGFGDDVTATAINFEFVYKWPLKRSPWTVYVGAGPAINIYHFDDNTDSEGGFNLLGGLEHDKGFFFEFKAGTFDSPDLKVGVGYTFRMH